MNLDPDGFKLSKSQILGEDYYTLKFFRKQIGKCIIIKTRNPNEVLLKYIEIIPKFRKMGLSQYLWNYTERDLISKEITKVTLAAEERGDGYNKLVKLYQSWGFIRIDDKEKYVYRGEECVRQVRMQKELIQKDH